MPWVWSFTCLHCFINLMKSWLFLLEGMTCGENIWFSPSMITKQTCQSNIWYVIYKCLFRLKKTFWYGLIKFSYAEETVCWCQLRLRLSLVPFHGHVRLSLVDMYGYIWFCKLCKPSFFESMALGSVSKVRFRIKNERLNEIFVWRWEGATESYHLISDHKGVRNPRFTLFLHPFLLSYPFFRPDTCFTLVVCLLSKRNLQ